MLGSPQREKKLEVVMLSRSYILCAALVLLSGRGFADTVIIDYSVAQVGNTGNTYIYTYSIDNNGTLPGMAPVQLFDIFFDPALYQQASITNVTPAPLNTQWSPTILFGVGSDPAAFDAESFPGIAVGSTVSGFAVEFNYLGQGLPGIQPFEIYNPNTFAEIQLGSTQLFQSGSAAPEPSTGSCILGMLLLGGVWTFRRQPRSAGKG
jgi:hypothetical protein